MSNLDIADNYEKMEKVAVLFTKGHNYTQIGETLGLRRIEVEKLHGEWQKFIAKMSQGNPDIRDRVMSILIDSDNSFALVIKEAWETVQQADQAGELANKNGALKIVASVTKDRARLALDAGAGQDTELAAQLEETAQKQDILMKILREVTGHCDNCRVEVRRRLSEINSEAEVVEVSAE